MKVNTLEVPLGKIITFYSYKGGTGRSMALANIAWILASNGNKVLVIDWDLEAPGLHRYFAPFLVDKELTATDGLIDFVNDYATETMTRNGKEGSVGPDWYKEHADILKYAVSLNYEFYEGGTLDLVPAGRQGPTYSTRVNLFNWQLFYDRLGGGAFFEAAKDRMREEYDYILIDSRTGVSDTSGICTVQMPDVLVVCFTLNNQSVEGAAAVTTSAFEQRVERPLRIFPVPMRVDSFEKRKLDLRKEFAKTKFSRFPAHLTSRREREMYLEDVQFQYIPFYAYEELLAVFGDKPEEAISLLKPAERLTAYVTEGRVSQLGMPPNEKTRQEVLALYEGRALEIDPAIAIADAAMRQLSSNEQIIAHNIFKRLVRAASPQEGGDDVAVKYRFDDFDRSAQEVAHKLSAERVITIENDTTLGSVARLTYDSLIKKWEPLRNWINDDRDFLIWRQKLNAIVTEWQRLNEDKGALLTGALLEEAKKQKLKRESDLNANEMMYIDRSIAEEQEQIRIQLQRKEQIVIEETKRLELEHQNKALIEVTEKLEIQKRRRLILTSAIVLLLLAGGGYLVYTFFKTGNAITISTQLTEAGNNDLKNGSFNEAVKKYSDAIRNNPINDNAFFGRGRAYLEIKNYDRAISDFSESIKINPNNADTYLYRAKAYEQKENILNAQADYNAAIGLSPKNAKAYAGRGGIYLQLGDHEKALSDFTQALNIEQNNYEAYLGRGNTYAAMERYDRAVTDYDQAIKTSRYSPTAFLNRAAAYEKLGDKAKAIENYTQALEFSPADQNNSQIRDQAVKALQALRVGPQVVPLPPSQTNPKIFLFFQDATDNPTLQAISKALSANPSYNVADKFQLVTQPTSGDVRYFYPDDKSNAENIKSIVERTLKQRGITESLELIFRENLAVKAPRGVIEVWLPSLQPASRNSPSQSAPLRNVNPPANKLPRREDQRQQQQRKKAY